MILTVSVISNENSLILYIIYILFSVSCMEYLSKIAQSLKRLNLFKVANQRTQNDIKQQKITTYVYLILLTGMFALPV